ncbi:hypothetical protein K0U00_01175, partial [Paenibacillus sepulcri]|nr:hypothetical protein [Paenibacillus sepulcri]
GLSILATVASSVTASATDPSSNEAMLSGFHNALAVGGSFALFALLLALISMRKKKATVQHT